MIPKKTKLWEKDISLNKIIEEFTVGKDRELDIFLAEYDIIGSLAHITMLQVVGLLSEAELKLLRAGLFSILDEIRNGSFMIKEGVEDIHSQVEIVLTERFGEVGGKVHSGRSRNDQVLLDIRLFLRTHIQHIVEDVSSLFDQLISLSDQHKDKLMPGYTHLQVAMPSSFGLWFAAFAESLVDDLIQLQAAYQIINKNPLGSAAGYGSSFPIQRKLTTELLGFNELNYNSIYAQMGRGRSERIISQAMASIADTLGKLAGDIILYLSQNFAFISFPDSLTTGSSIMPHKKNPDVFEILRAKCNRLRALPNEIILLTANLPVGYHRDVQLLKELLIPAVFEVEQCLRLMNFTLQHIQVKENLLEDERYRYIFSVEAVNQLAATGIPFRQAYQQVSAEIESRKFQKPQNIKYTHEGSIGNLCNEEIKRLFEEARQSFNFTKADAAIAKLITS